MIGQNAYLVFELHICITFRLSTETFNQTYLFNFSNLQYKSSFERVNTMKDEWNGWHFADNTFKCLL